MKVLNIIDVNGVPDNGSLNFEEFDPVTVHGLSTRFNKQRLRCDFFSQSL